MPAISRIRFTNVIYENGGKRYNDETFLFDGHNSAFLLENGGGKTVFIQTALQAVIPHINMAERKIKDTLSLDVAPAHIAIEWIINDKPRRYVMTAVSLYIENNTLNSLKYTYDYDAQDGHGIEDIPFSIAMEGDKRRPATRGEMAEYYTRMGRQSAHANVFNTIQDYGRFIENTYKIIPSEWRKVATINSGEGNVDEFFNKCRTTDQLLSNLLIPVVEEAIEGDHATGFVETFQRQREHFKKNRILQDKIEQSRLIKEKIDGYVKVYGNYHKERKNFESLKSEGKTISNYVKNQMSNKEEALRLNEHNHEQLKKDWRLYEQEEKSFELYLLKEQKKELETRGHITQSQKDEEQERYDTMAARKQNIDLTRLGKDIAAEETQIKHLQEELDRLDTQVEVVDIKKLLEENGCAIKGQFTYELELIDRELRRVDSEGTELRQKEKELENRHGESLAYEKDLIGQRSQLEGTLQVMEANEQRLHKLLNGDGPQVALSLHKDNLENEKLHGEREYDECLKRIEALNQYIETKTKAHESLVTGQAEAKEKLSVAGQQLSSLEKAMDRIKIMVEESGYPLFLNGNIYSKESSILRELEEQREHAYHLKEKAIAQERIHLRQFDVYENLSQYISEPMLESLVQVMKDEFSFVELGANYISELKTSYKVSTEDLFDRFPFWSMTVVTSVKDVAGVKAKLSEHLDSFTQMVLVLSREACARIAQGETHDFNVVKELAVIPDEWQTGLEPDRYYEWQQSLREKANEAITFRQQKEQAFLTAEQRLEKTRSFFGDYSYETFETLKGTIAGLEAEYKQMTSDLQALNMGIREDQDSLLKTTELQESLRVTLDSIRSRWQLIRQLEEDIAQREQMETQLGTVVQSFEELTDQISDSEGHMERLKHQLDDLSLEYNKFMAEREKITGLELYEEVKPLEARGGNQSLEGLKEERIHLKHQLTGLSRSRGEIETRIREHRQLLNRYSQELRLKEREAKHPIVLVEATYEGEVEDLFDKMAHCDQVLGQLLNQLRREEKQLTQIDTRCQVLKESLERTYGGVVTFDVESQHIEQRLKIEKATLQDRNRKLIKEKKAIETLIHQYDMAHRDLEIKDGSHHFMAMDVTPLNLPLDYFDGFEEGSEAMVRELLSSLDGQSRLTQKRFDEVQKERQQVMDFCRNNISDRRLMETLAAGLDSKSDYEELLVYQEKMTEIIMKIIKVAEDDKRESDLELQTFLSHLLSYVRSVTTELDVIQKKTRITLDDQVRQIFVFDIPEWDEEEAKLGLRNYVDETILYYEKESLHEEVNDEVLRKSLSERLSVMRLLEVVLGGQSIRIKCRKVTNDMKVNKAPMTWESSNKWSGGEKWSKNMTLFLSILNYLAEKKQHLTANQKRQRAVILDNPFGKASSDHVLKPVFVVAEKLGFQIIALTAHAEGKFISEYFPVVYSCRLRKTKDPSKQIMTNEKILNHTYLREHAPMTIMRMQEVEQISLF